MKCAFTLAILVCLTGCGESGTSNGRQAPETTSVDDADSRATHEGGAPESGAGDARVQVPDAADAAGGWPDGIDPLVCNGTGSRYVTAVPSHEFGPGQDTGRSSFPEIVFGPPKGGGCCMGSLDVVSLGNGGSVVVEFDGNAIVDGDGPDFIVFENAFSTSGDLENPFAELATVAVSEDGRDWVEFECTAVAYPYGSCAGWHPVYANPDVNDIDPTDPAVAGGDAFDLADIGVQEARFVRITDRVDLTGTNGVFDLDAVAIVHPLCP